MFHYARVYDMYGSGSEMEKRLTLYLGPMRVPFLVLAPVCALLGVATARMSGGAASWLDYLLVFIGAVGAHVGVNAYNEYHDYKSNLDAKTAKTPFSGGSGTLQKHPTLARYTLIMATTAVLITIGIGVYFAVTSSFIVVPFGAAGALIVYLYTPHIVRRPILCLVSPGIGFGPCMVLGAHVALGGTISWAAVLISTVPFFLVNNLLLLNQFPDVDADRSVGRKNLPIVAGTRVSAIVYCVFLLLTYGAIGLGVALHILPSLSLIGLLTVPLALVSCKGALQFDGDVKRLMPGLGMNVLTVLLTPALVSVGIFLSL